MTLKRKPLDGLFVMTVGQAEASTPESAEFLSLLRGLFPHESGRNMLCREFRLWLNGQTGLDVPNGTVMDCARAWLPRLREMVA